MFWERHEYKNKGKSPMTAVTSKEEQNPVPNFKRKTIQLNAKKFDPFGLVFLIAFVLFLCLVYKKTDWKLVKEMPRVSNNTVVASRVSFFKPYKQEPTQTEKDVNSADAVFVSFVKESNDYDPIIKSAASQFGLKSIVLKAIVEQESHYNPNRVKYEPKWEKDYGPKIPKKKWENLEEWKLNFYSYGLMQVGYALHKDTCGLKSFTDLFDPKTNIYCGAKLLSDCIKSGNSQTQCIKNYNGSGADAEQYKNEVLTRVTRLLPTNRKFG